MSFTRSGPGQVAGNAPRAPAPAARQTRDSRAGESKPYVRRHRIPAIAPDRSGAIAGIRWRRTYGFDSPARESRVWRAAGAGARGAFPATWPGPDLVNDIDAQDPPAVFVGCAY